MENKVSQSHRAANDRYDAKTYKKITIGLRIEDDADIIAEIEAAKKKGMKIREWIRSIYDETSK